MEIFTIGHSNISIEQFTAMLKKYRIETLVDIRSYPTSSHFPQFNGQEMARYLRKNGIGYVHISKLGGRRPKQEDIDEHINKAWKNPSFHNYADWSMKTEYEEGLTRLISIGSKRRSAYNCSERDYWCCHRLLVSNSLVARGHDVYHIRTMTELIKHRLDVCGAPTHVENGIVTYPSNKPVQMRLSI